MNDVMLDEGLRRWIIATALKNMWRLGRWYSLEDLVQDGFMVYTRVRNKYPKIAVMKPTKNQRRHFMALFKRAFLNHIHTRASQRPINEMLGDDTGVVDWAASASIAPDAPLLVKLREAPQEIAELIVLLLMDTSESLYISIGRRKLRETTNDHIARLLGHSPGQDYRALLTKYISE